MGWTTAVGDFFPGWLMTGLNFGMAYPKGDQDELFALGDAWKHAAAELEKLEPTLKGTTDQVPQYYVGDGATAATTEFATLFDGGEHSIQKLIEGLEALGHDARSTATEIEFAKIQSEIFAVMTLWTVVSLMSSLVGSTAVPAYLAAARAVLAKFAAEVAERIGTIMAESGLKTLAAPLVREIIVPLGERIAPLGEKLTAAGEKLTAAGDKWAALNQTIAKSGPMVRYPVAALKGGLHGGLMGAGLDAGTQVVQIMEGHRDDGFNLKQTFQTSLQWGAGGALGGPTGELMGRSLMNRALKDPSKELPKWLGGTLTGGVSGVAGAAGMYGAGLGTQLYDNNGDWSKVNKSFSPQLLIGGLAMGTMGGGSHGLEEHARINSAANIEAGTKQAPVQSAAVPKTDSPQALDTHQKPFSEQFTHPQAGDVAQQGGGPRSNSLGQEKLPSNGPSNAPEHRGSQPGPDARGGAGETNRPTAETPKPADAGSKPSANGARPAADISARVANAAPADQRANFVAGVQDKPVQGPVARAPEVRAPEVQTAAPEPEQRPARSEASIEPTRANDITTTRPDALPAPEGVRPDQSTDGASPTRETPSDNAPRTDPPADRDHTRPSATTTKPDTNTRTPDKVLEDGAGSKDRRDGDPAPDQPVTPLPYVEPAEGPRTAPSQTPREGARRNDQPRAADLTAERPNERPSEHPQKFNSQSLESEAHPVETHPAEGDWSPRPDDDWSRMSVQEISDELANRWGVDTAGFDLALHPEVVREFARAVDDMLSRYPDVNLPKIAIEKLPDDYLAATDWDISPDGQMYTEAMILNETQALNPEEMARVSAELEANGHFVPSSGDRPIHSILVHEFGHSIVIEGQGHASETASAALENYYRSTRGGMDRPAYEKWLDQLSDYSFHEDGQLHPDEALAEAFADVEINGEAASEPAKVLYWHLLDSAGEHSIAPNGFTHIPEDAIARPNGPHTPDKPSAEHSVPSPDAAPHSTTLTPELRDSFEGLRDRATEIVHAQGDPARVEDMENLRQEFAKQFDELGLRNPEGGADSWKLFHEHDHPLAEYLTAYAHELLPPTEEAPAHAEPHTPAEIETPQLNEAVAESSAPSPDESGPHVDADRPSTLTPHLKDRFEQMREPINDIFAAHHDPARAPELPELRAKFGELFDGLGLRDPEAEITAWQLFNDHDATLAQYVVQNREHLLPRAEDVAEVHVEPHTDPSGHEPSEQPHNEHPKEEPHPDSPDAEPHNEIPDTGPAAELTPDEHNAVYRYTDPDANVFSDLNHRLRNGLELDPEQQKLVADIASGLEKLPTYDGTVWRGAHLTPEQIALYVPGAKVPEPSFTSTSRDPRRIFSSSVEFVMHSETGRDISTTSARPNEKEVLFKPGTTFEVRGVVEDPKAGLFGVTRIYLYESSEHAPIHGTPADHTGHEGQLSDHSSAPSGDAHPSEELPVRHGPDRTALGDSPEVQRVYDNVRNEGEHDVVVHGDRFGKPTTEGNSEVDPQRVVEAIRNNPNYVEGTPIRLLSCHSGNDIGWAQHVADELGVPVRAPSDLVGVRAVPDSPAILHNAAEWRTFQPTEADGTRLEPAIRKPIEQPDGRLPKYEEDPRENWDILGNEKTGDETTPLSDRTTEPKPDAPVASEAPKAAVPEQGPRQDLPADQQPSRDIEQQPRSDGAPIRNDAEQPRATDDHETEHASIDADGSHELSHDVDPIPLTPDEIQSDWGIPEENQQKIHGYGDDQNLVIEVRPTNVDSVPHLEEGAMPKPMEVKDKTVNDDDVALGAPEWAKGLVGRFEPGMLKLPEEGTVSPERMEALKDRLAKRNKDFEAYRDHMEDLGAEFRVTDEGIVEGLYNGKYRPVAGDHDLFDIRHADGTRLSAEELELHARELIRLDAGIQHPPHVYWEPASEFQRTRNFEEIINNHQFDAPSDSKKEPLVQFRPHEQPVLKWAEKDVAGVDREMIPWHVNGKLDELHTTQRLALDEVTQNHFDETHPDATPDEQAQYEADRRKQLDADVARLRETVDELTNHPDFDADTYRALVNSGFKTPIDVTVDGHREPMLFIDRGGDFEPILARIDGPEYQLAALRKEVEAGIKNGTHPSDILRNLEDRPAAETKAPLAESPETAKELGRQLKESSEAGPNHRPTEEHSAPIEKQRPHEDEPSSEPQHPDLEDAPPAPESPLHDAERTDAGFSFHPDDPELAELARRVANDPNYVTVDVHITEDGNIRVGDRVYTPEEFGDHLRQLGYDGEKPIRLIGCDAATNDVAARLAAHLDTDVLAPTKPAWTDPEGRVYTSTIELDANGNRRPRIPPDGEWELVHSDGTTTRVTDDGYAPGTPDSHRANHSGPDGAMERSSPTPPNSGVQPLPNYQGNFHQDAQDVVNALNGAGRPDLAQRFVDLVNREVNGGNVGGLEDWMAETVPRTHASDIGQVLDKAAELTELDRLSREIGKDPELSVRFNPGVSGSKSFDILVEHTSNGVTTVERRVEIERMKDLPEAASSLNGPALHGADKAVTPTPGRIPSAETSVVMPTPPQNGHTQPLGRGNERRFGANGLDYAIVDPNGNVRKSGNLLDELAQSFNKNSKMHPYLLNLDAVNVVDDNGNLLGRITRESNGWGRGGVVP